MTENLRLDGDTIVEPEKSDVSESFALASAQTSGAITWNANTNHVYATGNTRLYSWYTATAGTGNETTSSGDASASICPKRWELPSANGDKNFLSLLNGEYGIPGPYVSLDSVNYTVLTSFPLSHQNDGNAGIYCGKANTYGCGYVTSVTGSPTTYGYWTKTAYDASHTYHFSYPAMGINHWGGWGNAQHPNRDWGTSIRCVAK